MRARPAAGHGWFRGRRSPNDAHHAAGYDARAGLHGRLGYKVSGSFYADAYYTTADSLEGWPQGLPVPQNTLAKSFTHRNIGRIVNQGVEVSLDVALLGGGSAFGNWSFQADPRAAVIRRDEINTPPRHRFNLGAAWSNSRFFADANLNYAGAAFWTDVLDARVWGPTEAYAQVNAAAGMKPLHGRLTASVLAGNLFDARVQQHVFGDLLSRKVTAELRSQP